MADDFEKGGSPLYARLARVHADDPRLAAIVADHRPLWDAVLRLFGGAHYLQLTGAVADPWSSFGAMLEEHGDRLSRFVREQSVQTNEVQRCWGLLPAFLAVVDERPVDLVELGPSAGLNLFWDRYCYRYPSGSWGPENAVLELVGSATGGPPQELLAVRLKVRGRTGIDRSPVAVATPEGRTLLRAFVWADQAARRERLERAMELARAEPPRLIAGDFVDRLPALLAERDRAALTVVFHSCSTGYLTEEARARLRELIGGAVAEGDVAHVSYEREPAVVPGLHNWVLEVEDRERGPRRLARLDGHANRMEWLA